MKKEVKILGAIVIVVVIAAIVGANYYRSSVQNERVTTNSNTSKGTINTENLIRPDSPTLRAADAPVKVVDYYNPQCEAYAAFHPNDKKQHKEHKGNEGKGLAAKHHFPFENLRDLCV